MGFICFSSQSQFDASFSLQAQFDASFSLQAQFDASFSLQAQFDASFSSQSQFDASFSLQAQFDASELITQREMVSRKINEDLTLRGGQFGLLIDDISIVSIAYHCIDWLGYLLKKTYSNTFSGWKT